MDRLIPVQVVWRDNSTAYLKDKDWNKFSMYAKVPMEDDELCSKWWIYKVERIYTYTYKVVSKREDRKYPSEKEDTWFDLHMCYSCDKPVHRDQMYFWHWNPICDLCREW